MSVLPLSYSEVIMKYLKVFSDHASGLGAFGLAGLALTALLMIDKFFVTVNRIFRVRRMRSWAQRAMIYWALLTLGPIAIALSITLSTQAIRIAAGAAGTGGLPGWLFALIQIILQTIGYAILFKLVPNCRVPFTHALTGGAAVALAGQVFREAFEYYITAGTLSSIYGAFVAFPVFCSGFILPGCLFSPGLRLPRRFRSSLPDDSLIHISSETISSQGLRCFANSRALERRDLPVCLSWRFLVQWTAILRGSSASL